MAASGIACSSDAEQPPAQPPPEAPPDVGCADCVSLTGGMVFDGTRAEPGTVVLRGSSVETVVLGEARVIAGEVVDVTGHTVLPGLFDLHVHSNGESGPYGYFSIENLMEPNMKGRLRAGLLSYLDLGSLKHTVFEMRARLRDGRLLGPNLFAAGPLLTPHGGHPCYHGDPSHGFCSFIDAQQDVATELAQLLPDQPDVIKIVIEAGTPARPLPRLSKESIDALGAAAQAEGLRMIAHVSEIEDMRLALDGGIRLFAHIPGEDLIDADLVQRLVEADATIVPTLAVYDALHRIAIGEFVEADDPALVDEVSAEVLAAFHDAELLEYMTSPAAQELYGAWAKNAYANFRTCVEAGVRIAAGTDAGNPGVFHGPSIHRELALYVENGMSPLEALTAGTRTAADLLGRDDLGRLEAGSVADVVVVEGDALADISALQQVRRVYRAGELLDLDALSLRQDSSLVREPVTGLGDGDTCLDTVECGEDFYCGWLGSCGAVCGFSGGCEQGDACFPQSGSDSAGWCYPGDGCDLIAQDCDNGAACIWVGNGSAVCWFAGQAVAGEPCDEGMSTCAPGAQCDFASGQCLQLCDPTATTPSCPAGTTCTDRTVEAGLTIGECE
jgi:imidazolonepropionase-like amidohydrolase